MSEADHLPNTYCHRHYWMGQGGCPQCTAIVCENCGKEPSTDNWGGTNDSVSLARNPQLAQRWCKRCVLTAQRDYIKNLIPKLEEIERQLRDLP